jgi:hypothetical protein
MVLTTKQLKKAIGNMNKTFAASLNQKKRGGQEQQQQQQRQLQQEQQEQRQLQQEQQELQQQIAGNVKVYTGPKQGKFIINKHGKKVYIDRKTLNNNVPYLKKKAKK